MRSLPEREQNIIKKYSGRHVNPDDFDHKAQVLPIPEAIPRPNWLSQGDNPVYASPSDNPSLYFGEEVKKIRKSAQIVAGALSHLKENLRVGMSADDADRLIHEYIVGQGAYPSGVGFMGFPKSVCVSANDGKLRGPLKALVKSYLPSRLPDLSPKLDSDKNLKNLFFEILRFFLKKFDFLRV